MLTGQIRNDIDKLWETFWTGGITNPLTVIKLRSKSNTTIVEGNYLINSASTPPSTL